MGMVNLLSPQKFMDKIMEQLVADSLKTLSTSSTAASTQTERTQRSLIYCLGVSLKISVSYTAVEGRGTMN